MKRLLLGLAVLVGSSAAQAQLSPKIAYLKLGSGKNAVHTVNVANANSSNAAVVYSSSKSIYDVQLSPSGLQVAVAGQEGLRLISYSVSGSSLSVSSSSLVDATPNIQSADFSFDGGKLAWRHDSGNGQVSVKVMNLSDSSVSVYPISNPLMMKIAYVQSGDIAHVDMDSGGGSYGLYLLDLVSGIDSLIMNTSSTEFGNIDHISGLSSRNSVIVQGGCRASSSSCGSINLYEVDVVSGAVSSLVKSSLPSLSGGSDSADNITFFQASSAKSSDVYIAQKNASSGIISRLSSRAASLRQLDVVP